VIKNGGFLWDTNKEKSSIRSLQNFDNIVGLVSIYEVVHEQSMVTDAVMVKYGDMSI
jgi:hypothetical protein